MKKWITTITAVFIFVIGYSQKIAQITINGKGNADAFIIGLDENVKVYLTKDGNITKWGYDRYEGVQENYNDLLDAYVGRVEYYTQNDDEALRGKVKYIGKTLLTYYPSYENEILKGKLKAIGSINIHYFLAYEDAAVKGNIKTLGQQNITWYASYENEGLRGKLKTVGTTTLAYYSSFEDKAYRGKVKSINNNIITYYSSFENYSGNFKTGRPIFTENGIKYWVRNY